MKFHYAGKYDGDEKHLPQREHPDGAVPFKEPDLKQLSLIANVGSIATMIVLAVPFYIRGRQYIGETMYIGMLLSLLSLVPHEFLHALCFKGDVYMYENLRQGMLFVAGTEDMSKARFIFMSLLPNIVFGFIPYIIFLCNPRLTAVGFFGILCTGMGFGDYTNVFNAVRQMPPKAKTYLCGSHSYWYLPDKNV